MVYTPLDVPKRLYTHYRKLYLTWKHTYRRYLNPHFDNQEWECLEEWAVFCGLDPDSKLFGTYSSRYDGHTLKMFTIFGLCFGKMYTYQARPYEHPQAS